MRHTPAKLLLAFAILLFTLPAFAAENPIARKEQNRVALVVGNSNYSGEIDRLGNPVNDARAMASVLEQVGFSVTKLEDTDYSELREAIWDFGKRLREADAALFYFSGHGVQYNGSNYLLPLDRPRFENPKLITVHALSGGEPPKPPRSLPSPSAQHCRGVVGQGRKIGGDDPPIPEPSPPIKNVVRAILRGRQTGSL